MSLLRDQLRTAEIQIHSITKPDHQSTGIQKSLDPIRAKLHNQWSIIATGRETGCTIGRVVHEEMRVDHGSEAEMCAVLAQQHAKGQLAATGETSPGFMPASDSLEQGKGYAGYL